MDSSNCTHSVVDWDLDNVEYYEHDELSLAGVCTECGKDMHGRASVQEISPVTA